MTNLFGGRAEASQAKLDLTQRREDAEFRKGQKSLSSAAGATGNRMACRNFAFLCVFATLRQMPYPHRKPGKRAPFVRISLFVVILAAFSPSARSADEYLLEFIHPQGGQVGTTVEVMIEGAFLQHLEEVLFYQPGIRCTKFETMDTVLSIDNGQRREAEAGRAAKLTFEISKDAQPGEYQLRIANSRWPLRAGHVLGDAAADRDG